MGGTPTRTGRYVAVVGPGETASSQEVEYARVIGALLANSGCVLITGGLGGVMAGAADGASAVGGTVRRPAADLVAVGDL